MSGGEAETGTKSENVMVGKNSLHLERMRNAAWEVEQTEGEEEADGTETATAY